MGYIRRENIIKWMQYGLDLLFFTDNCLETYDELRLRALSVRCIIKVSMIVTILCKKLLTYNLDAHLFIFTYESSARSGSVSFFR